MSIDRAVRDLIRDEIDAQLRPLQGDLSVLRGLVERLGGVFTGVAVRRGSVGNSGAGRRPRRTRAETGANDRPCALAGCKNTARAKGYCAAHYQKYRNLSRTNRLPSDWKEYAPPNSVKDVVLPRGRAAAKALKEARK
jgi:hypothetical protein